MDTKTRTIQSLKELKTNTACIAYTILQLKRGDKFHGKRFERYDRTLRLYGRINIEDYQLEGAFQIVTEESETNARLLERIYTLWNAPTRPTGIRFTGHSLSVSDIVTLYRDGKVRFFFCDSYGFKELENELTLIV